MQARNENAGMTSSSLVLRTATAADAAALERLAADPAHLSRVREGAAARGRSLPTWRQSADRFFAVVKAAFSQRRKTLRNSLAGLAGSPSRVEGALAAAGLSPSARAEEVGLEGSPGAIAAALDAPPAATIERHARKTNSATTRDRLRHISFRSHIPFFS